MKLLRKIKGTILCAVQCILSFLEGKAGGTVVTGVSSAMKEAAGSHCVNVAIAASGFSIAVTPLVMIAAGAVAYVLFQYIRKQIKTGEISEVIAELLALVTEGATAIKSGLFTIFGRDACGAFAF